MDLEPRDFGRNWLAGGFVMLNLASPVSPIPVQLQPSSPWRLGIGSRLCQHSLHAAQRLCGRWHPAGAGAFCHMQLGYVDALVMSQPLL